MPYIIKDENTGKPKRRKYTRILDAIAELTEEVRYFNCTVYTLFDELLLHRGVRIKSPRELFRIINENQKVLENKYGFFYVHVDTKDRKTVTICATPGAYLMYMDRLSIEGTERDPNHFLSGRDHPHL